MPIGVSIIEDERDTREALAKWLRRCGEIRFLEAYPNAEAALRGVPATVPDVLLMDLQLPKLSGVECARQFKARLPSLKILVLTKHENAELIFQALRAGADGYVLKRKLPQLLAAIQDVHQGGAWLSSEVAACVVAHFRREAASRSQLNQLTGREYQILDRLALGERYRDIAEALEISFQTVNGHIKSIYEKLQVHCRTDAVRKYLDGNHES